MNTGQTFWEHLDVLRGCILRILVAVVIGSVAAFFMKDWLFGLIFAPCNSDFIIYRLINADDFHLHLINTGLTEQIMIHLKMALCIGIIVVSPYIIFVLYGFISPALYDNERQHSIRIILSAFIMFFVGVIINYFIIFPLTVRFLGTYQLSSTIDNMLTVSSYIDTLLMMTLLFGIIFEIPVLSWILARLGLLKTEWMTLYRRHAIVAILIIAAVITPTADILTLSIVSLPIWLLYELSIFIVLKTSKHNVTKN